MKKLITLLLLSSSLFAGTFTVQKITDNVYALVGELGNRTNENFANNSTHGVVITDEGVVLIDAGGTYRGAQEIHNTIKTLTDKSIVKVINTGGQDHRFLGNGYFKALGAEIIASNDAVADQKARLQEQFFRLNTLIDSKFVEQTKAVYADTTFDKEYKFTLGSTPFEIYHKGAAHTPGDSFVYLPQEHVVFAGDIVFVKRMLGVNSHSNSASWVKVFEAMAALQPQVVVPGHGLAVSLEVAKKDTYQYLKDLREKVADFMDDGGDISDVSQVDMSKYQYLLNYDAFSGRNAQRVFSELEWE